jgi:hypothetical protein
MIIDSILDVDLRRGTRDLAEAAKTTAKGYLKAEDVTRLLVWHTPEFPNYRAVMSVLREVLELHPNARIRVMGITARLFEIALYRPEQPEPAASVLVELDQEGRALGAELLQMPGGPLSMVYQAQQGEVKYAEGWLDKLAARWKRGPVPFQFVESEQVVLEDAPRHGKKPKQVVRADALKAQRNFQISELLIDEKKLTGEVRLKVPGGKKDGGKFNHRHPKKQHKPTQQVARA